MERYPSFKAVFHRKDATEEAVTSQVLDDATGYNHIKKKGKQLSNAIKLFISVVMTDLWQLVYQDNDKMVGFASLAKRILL